MIRRPPGSTRTDTLFPDASLFRLVTGNSVSAENDRAISVVLAGGGTAGHVEPAMAVADALTALDPNVRITALGTARGLETRLRSEEHKSELQSLMRISYAVLRLNKTYFYHPPI